MSNLLYIACNAHVCAIDPRTGEERWRTKLSGGAFSFTTGNDVCILEHDGLVFAGCMGHLFALDHSSGKIVWHNELSGLGHNDVTLAIAGKSIQYVSSHSTSRT